MPARPDNVPNIAEEQDDGSWIALDILDEEQAIRREAWAPDGTRLYRELLHLETRNRLKISLFLPGGQADLNFEQEIGEVLRSDASARSLSPTLPEFPDNPSVVSCTFEMLEVDAATLRYEIGRVAFFDDTHQAIDAEGNPEATPAWLPSFDDTQETDVKAPQILSMSDAASVFEDESKDDEFDEGEPTDNMDTNAIPEIDLAVEPVDVDEPDEAADIEHDADDGLDTGPATAPLAEPPEHLPSLDELEAGGLPPSLDELEAGGLPPSLDELEAGGLPPSLDELEAGGLPPSLDELEADPVDIEPVDIEPVELEVEPLEPEPVELEVEPLEPEPVELEVEPLEPEPEPAPEPKQIAPSHTPTPPVRHPFPDRDGRFIATREDDSLQVEVIYDEGDIVSFIRNDSKGRPRFKRTVADGRDMLVIYGPKGTLSYIRNADSRRVQVQHDGLVKWDQSANLADVNSARDFASAFDVYAELHRHFPYHKLDTPWRLDAFGFEPYRAFVDEFDEFFDATIFAENRIGDWLVMIDEPGPHQGKIFINYVQDGLYHLDDLDEFIMDNVEADVARDRNRLIEAMPFFEHDPILGGFGHLYEWIDMKPVPDLYSSLRHVPALDLADLM